MILLQTHDNHVHTLELHGLIFTKYDTEGDFQWMIGREEYRDVLFVFNDMEEQFLAYRENPRSYEACSSGEGNSVIRPWQCKSYPHAAGIPVGKKGVGYSELNFYVKIIIDHAISNIADILAKGQYRRIVYSAMNHSGDLDTGTLNVAEDVKKYIVSKLKSLQ